MPLWTQTDIDTLRTAIASGVLSVSYDGPPRRTLTYQSLHEMRDLLASMQQDVARASGGSKTTRYASTRKGL